MMCLLVVGKRANTRAVLCHSSQPVIDEEKRGPEKGFSIVRGLEQGLLRQLQGPGSRYAWFLEMSVKRLHQDGGSIICHQPQGGQSAACPRLNRYAGQP